MVNKIWVLIKPETGEYYSESRGKETVVSKDVLCARKFLSEKWALSHIRVEFLIGFDPKELVGVNK